MIYYTSRDNLRITPLLKEFSQVKLHYFMILKSRFSFQLKEIGSYMNCTFIKLNLKLN